MAGRRPTDDRRPAPPAKAIDVADRDPATCEPDSAVADLPSHSDVVVVVNKDGIVLGRVRLPVEGAAETPVGELMEPGPATVRATSRSMTFSIVWVADT